MGAYVDLTIDAGTDFATTIDLIADDGTPINITGYAFNSQIRKSYYSVNAAATLMVSVVDGANGLASITLDAPNTSIIFPGRYVYDVLMIDNNNVKSRVLQGIVTVTPQVTFGPAAGYP
jgi:hypothetical protein